MFVVIQDVFINQILQIFVVHVVILEALRPQLRKIYHILNDIVATKLYKSDSDDLCSVVRVCQHMSSSCRAARAEAVRRLPSSQLLMRIEDTDVALCRLSGRGIKLSWITTAIILIPTLLALSNDTIQEAVLNIALPTIWSCFLIANAYLYKASPAALAVFYLLIILTLAYRYLIYLPRRRNANYQTLWIFRITAFIETSLEGFWSTLRSYIFRHRSTTSVMWRNMNANIQMKSSIPGDTPTSLNSSPQRSERDFVIKRSGSNMSDVLHVASMLSGNAVVTDIKKDPTDCILPEEIVAMRNARRQEKFTYRADKGTKLLSRLSNRVLWNAQTSETDEPILIPDVTDLSQREEFSLQPLSIRISSASESAAIDSPLTLSRASSAVFTDVDPEADPEIFQVDNDDCGWDESSDI